MVHTDYKARMDFNSLPEEQRRLTDKFIATAARVSPRDAVSCEKRAIHLLPMMALAAADKKLELASRKVKSSNVLLYMFVAIIVALQPSEHLQPRINRLGFESQHAENALVNSA
jgi:hypothetical protein